MSTPLITTDDTAPIYTELAEHVPNFDSRITFCPSGMETWCWLWDRDKLSMQLRHPKRHSYHLARTAYTLAFPEQELPASGKMAALLHVCGNIRCINPDHLTRKYGMEQGELTWLVRNGARAPEIEQALHLTREELLARIRGWLNEGSVAARTAARYRIAAHSASIRELEQADEEIPFGWKAALDHEIDKLRTAA